MSRACEQVITLPMAAKLVNAGWNDGSVRWRVLPRDPDTLRQATQSFETDSGPAQRRLQRDPGHDLHRRPPEPPPSTGWSPAVKKFRDENDAYDPGFAASAMRRRWQRRPRATDYSTDQVNLRLATGNVGVAAAINDTVREKRAHDPVPAVRGGVR